MPRAGFHNRPELPGRTAAARRTLPRRSAPPRRLSWSPEMNMVLVEPGFWATACTSRRFPAPVLPPRDLYYVPVKATAHHRLSPLPRTRRRSGRACDSARGETAATRARTAPRRRPSSSREVRGRRPDARRAASSTHERSCQSRGGGRRRAGLCATASVASGTHERLAVDAVERAAAPRRRVRRSPRSVTFAVADAARAVPRGARTRRGEHEGVRPPRPARRTARARFELGADSVFAHGGAARLRRRRRTGRRADQRERRAAARARLEIRSGRSGRAMKHVSVASDGRELGPTDARTARFFRSIAAARGDGDAASPPPRRPPRARWTRLAQGPRRARRERHEPAMTSWSPRAAAGAGNTVVHHGKNALREAARARGRGDR